MDAHRQFAHPFFATALLLLGATLSSCASPRSGDASAEETPLVSADSANSPRSKQNAVVSVNGEPLSRTEYADFMYDLAGRDWMERFVTVHLLQKEAERLGVAFTEAELDEATEAGIQTFLTDRFEGNAERFNEMLASRSHDQQSFAKYFRRTKRQELLQQRVTKAARVVDDEALQAAFHAEYGIGGIKLKLRHVVFAQARARLEMRRQGTPEEDLTNEKIMEALRERAQALRAELEGGADFADVAKRESHDNTASQTGGALTDYRYMRYGPVFAEAVRTAEVGELVGPIVTPTTVHLLEVTERTITQLEDVRAEVLAKAQAAEANLNEILGLEERLRAEAEIEIY